MGPYDFAMITPLYTDNYKCSYVFHEDTMHKILSILIILNPACIKPIHYLQIRILSGITMSIYLILAFSTPIAAVLKSSTVFSRQAVSVG